MVQKRQMNCMIGDVIKSVLLSLIIGIILTLVVTIILNFVPISDKILTIINIIIKIVAVFCGCLFGFKEKKSGIVKGLVCGLLYSIFSILIFGLIEKSLNFNTSTFIDMGICIVIGAICGILAVNLGKNKN